jgi:uncharacterized protein with FMN-binding domain
MRRITYWLLSTLSALVLLFGYHTSTSATTSASSSTAVVSTGTDATASSSGSSGSSTTKTLTGAVASTQWGPVQVQLTMSGGSITKVTVLQQPSGNPRDTEINASALPILIQETEQAGNAQIDMVSGATVTSTGYIQSLQSALDQA